MFAKVFAPGFFALAVFAGIFFSLHSTASAAGPNLVSNGNFESSSSGNPTGWVQGRWGTNTAEFVYPAAGPDGSQAAAVSLTSRSSGDAKWAFTPVNVTPGKTYTYTNSYKATVPTYVTLQYTHADGSLSYPDLGQPPASASWGTTNFSFTAPSGVTKVTVFHLINRVGALTIDNVELREETSGSSTLIPNPSLEAAGTGGNPASWGRGRWGTNTAEFVYPIAGYDGARAAEVRITSHSSGDAKWYFNPIAVDAGDAYRFTDYYKANTTSYVTVQFRKSDGSTSYQDIGTLGPSSSWKQFSGTFVVPSGTVSLTIFHLIKSTGTLAVDNYALAPTTVSDPVKFDKGYVSINFDDGWRSNYDNALPILEAKGFRSNQFITTQQLGPYYSGYITQSEVVNLQARGHEVGAHTRTHRALTTLSTAEARQEIEGSRQDLLSWGISPVNFFAYPFGAYNEQVKQLVRDAGFYAARSSDGGANDKQTDLYALRRQPMTSATTFSEVKGYIDNAMAKREWLILLFHRVDNSGDLYAVTPALFQQIVNYLDQQNIMPILLSEGVQKMQ